MAAQAGSEEIHGDVGPAMTATRAPRARWIRRAAWALLSGIALGCSIDGDCVEDTPGCAESCDQICADQAFACGALFPVCIQACPGYSEELKLCLSTSTQCGVDCASLGFDRDGGA